VGYQRRRGTPSTMNVDEVFYLYDKIVTSMFCETFPPDLAQASKSRWIDACDSDLDGSVGE
jgi:hypothetical protein